VSAACRALAMDLATAGASVVRQVFVFSLFPVFVINLFCLKRIAPQIPISRDAPQACPVEFEEYSTGAQRSLSEYCRMNLLSIFHTAVLHQPLTVADSRQFVRISYT